MIDRFDFSHLKEGELVPFWATLLLETTKQREVVAIGRDSVFPFLSVFGLTACQPEPGYSVYMKREALAG